MFRDPVASKALAGAYKSVLIIAKLNHLKWHQFFDSPYRVCGCLQHFYSLNGDAQRQVNIESNICLAHLVTPLFNITAGGSTYHISLWLKTTFPVDVSDTALYGYSRSAFLNKYFMSSGCLCLIITQGCIIRTFIKAGRVGRWCSFFSAVKKKNSQKIGTQHMKKINK